MNKKRLIFDILFVFSLTIIILLSSFFTCSFVATKDAKQNLVAYSNNIVEMIDEGETFSNIRSAYENVLNLRITILDDKGTPLLEINELDKEPFEEDRLSELTEHCNNFYYKNSLTMGYEVLYFVEKTDNFFIRVGMPKSSIIYYANNILIYGSVVLVVVNSLYALLKISSYRKNIKKLNYEIGNLKRISGENDAFYFDNVESISSAIKTTGNLIENKIKELEFQKNKTEFILDSINEGFIVLDANKKIKSINEYALKALKINKKVIDKNSLFLSLGKKFDEELDNSFKNKDYTFELEIHDKVYCFFSGTIKLKWDDEQIGLALMFFDITENKINEKIKKEFFQNASHELKTPLTTIIGYEGMIVNKMIESNDELQKANAAILKEADRMKNIIDDMLTLSNLENLDVVDNTNYFNVKNVIFDVVDELKYLLEAKHITLHLDCNDYCIKASLEDLERLIKNLLTNSIKYNKDNGSIFVILSEKTLIIKDSGIGIEQKYLNRIFERFFRVDKGRSRSEGGTGLGLAIVKHICIKYGFNIEVKSKINEGTEFIIKM